MRDILFLILKHKVEMNSIIFQIRKLISISKYVVGIQNTSASNTFPRVFLVVVVALDN